MANTVWEEKNTTCYTEGRTSRVLRINSGDVFCPPPPITMLIALSVLVTIYFKWIYADMCSSNFTEPKEISAIPNSQD
jgi:hypothetical protein